MWCSGTGCSWRCCLNGILTTERPVLLASPSWPSSGVLRALEVLMDRKSIERSPTVGDPAVVGRRKLPAPLEPARHCCRASAIVVARRVGAHALQRAALPNPDEAVVLVGCRAN